jgi:hypothetical protein
MLSYQPEDRPSISDLHENPWVKQSENLNENKIIKTLLLIMNDASTTESSVNETEDSK